MIKPNLIIKLRAHHLMCLEFYKGIGYSKKFVSNMNEIKDSLKTDPFILITDGADDICKCCPNNINGNCRSFDKVKQYDKKVISLTLIKTGQLMHYSTLSRIVYDKILLCNKRSDVCSACKWNDICHF